MEYECYAVESDLSANGMNELEMNMIGVRAYCSQRPTAVHPYPSPVRPRYDKSVLSASRPDMTLNVARI